MSKFEPLPQTKKKNGYMYTMVKRNKTIAMYSMVNIKYPPENLHVDDNGHRTYTSIEPNPICGYEVFKIGTVKAVTLFAKDGTPYSYPPKEKFPGNEEGGKTMWTFDKQENAEKKFEEISN